MNFGSNINLLLAVLIEGELIIILISAILGLFKEKSFKENIGTILLGIVERTFLAFSFIIGVQLSIVLFGVIKAATRFDSDSRIETSNSQFVTINIVSALFALVYFKAWIILV